MLNQGLALEHAARIQYLAHAELVGGPNAEPIMARLKEIASDEEKHEGKFRTLIGDYLGGEPGMTLAPTHAARTITEILEVNRKGEQDALAFYAQVYRKVIEGKQQLADCFETLEHEIRHIIIDEQEHVAELTILLGR